MEEYFPGLYEGLLYIFSELVTWFFVNNFREFLGHGLLSTPVGNSFRKRVVGAFIARALHQL